MATRRSCMVEHAKVLFKLVMAMQWSGGGGSGGSYRDSHGHALQRARLRQRERDHTSQDGARSARGHIGHGGGNLKQRRVVAGGQRRWRPAASHGSSRAAPRQRSAPPGPA